jgi:hypothetical protein
VIVDRDDEQTVYNEGDESRESWLAEQVRLISLEDGLA